MAILLSGAADVDWVLIGALPNWPIRDGAIGPPSAAQHLKTLKVSVKKTAFISSPLVEQRHEVRFVLFDLLQAALPR
jgi:hypothetical protein